MKPTGFKDKNGKDICVGDTVKFRSKKFRMSGKGIVLEDKQFGYVIKDTRTECKSRNIGRMYPLCNFDEREYEVISELKEENKPTCDRNICLQNEYNNIGCEDCIVMKGENNAE